MKKVIEKIFTWESFGMLCQLLLWVIIFLLLIFVVTVGFEFEEFRYVGF